MSITTQYQRKCNGLTVEINFDEQHNVWTLNLANLLDPHVKSMGIPEHIIFDLICLFDGHGEEQIK